MNAANDYLRLINELWTIDVYHLWDPYEHLTIAYILEKFDQTKSYQEKVEYWIQLSKENKYNELAWDIISLGVSLYNADDLVSERDKSFAQQDLDFAKKAYQDNKLTFFGFVDEKYAPDWFFEVYRAHMSLKELERENRVVSYFENECGMTYEKAKKQFDDLYKYNYEILNELYYYVLKHKYYTIAPLSIGGVTAKAIAEKEGVSVLQAYLKLIDLKNQK